MKDSQLLWIILIIVALVIGIIVGNLIAPQSQDITLDEEDDHDHTHNLLHAHEEENGEAHTHSLIEVPAENAPTVDLIIREDPKAGWNLQLVTTNFEFTPEDASLEHEPGTGHAHLYIDGTKITRLYGEWYHIPELSSGQHEVRITLSTNDHNDYAINNTVIEDTEIIIA